MVIEIRDILYVQRKSVSTVSFKEAPCYVHLSHVVFLQNV